jgi:hypothetical protein
MNCKQIGSLLIGYLEGSLDDKTYSNINDHLEKCEQCRNELYQMSLIENLTRAINPVFDEENLLKGIMASIKDSAVDAYETEKDDNIIDFKIEKHLIPPTFQTSFASIFSKKSYIAIAAAILFLILSFPLVLTNDSKQKEPKELAFIKNAVINQLKTKLILDEYIINLKDFNFSEMSEEIPVEHFLGYNN